jgi:hypothetical protein
MTQTSQSPRTLIITGGFISNHERHVADLRAHANTASAVGKAQSPMDERRERSTCVSGFPMKATSATRAVAWCSDGMLDDPQKSDSTGRDWMATNCLIFFFFLKSQVLYPTKECSSTRHPCT